MLTFCKFKFLRSNYIFISRAVHLQAELNLSLTMAFTVPHSASPCLTPHPPVFELCLKLHVGNINIWLTGINWGRQQQGRWGGMIRRNVLSSACLNVRPSHPDNLRMIVTNTGTVTLTDFGLVVRPRRSWLNSSFPSHDPLLSPLEEGAPLSSGTCPLITCTGSRLIFTIEKLSSRAPKCAPQTVLTVLPLMNKLFLSQVKRVRSNGENVPLQSVALIDTLHW